MSTIDAIINQVESQTRINDISKALTNRFELVFDPKKTLTEFNKEFAELRAYVRKRATELDADLANAEKADEKLKALEDSQKASYLYNRLLSDVNNKAFIVSAKFPGAAEFLLGSGAPKTDNSTIEKKLLSDQGALILSYLVEKEEKEGNIEH